ncbi:MAG: hypothetical protein QOF48_807 [Verrucomicrobiota bacterium]
MKKLHSLLALLPVLLAVLLAPARLLAADTLLITEFEASNPGPLADEDADFSDWIEIHNPGTNAVNANGWYLTDSASDLTKWRLPATNVPPNGYLIVFASGKDRRIAGKTLHTNFKLDAAGEYLGLIRPDGTTVASQYAPLFPVQIPHVSYGIPVQQNVTTLLATGAAARFYIPSNDVLGSAWINPAFDDSSWGAATTGIGYETDGQGLFIATDIADSVADFSGKQGSNNWYYGYWNRQADPNGIYSDLDMSFFPNANEAYGSNNFWNGVAWDWFNGDPPFTQINAQGGIPNATNGNPARPDHWAIRRYVSEVAGAIKITGQLTHTGDWVYVTSTGVAANSLIYIYLTAAGEGYVDDMKLVLGSVAESGPNLLPNGDFESALTGPWTVSANHAASAIVSNVKHGGASSLHLVADVGGTTQASAIWQTIAPALDITTPATYTLSYWFKPGTNNTPLAIRFSGNWITTTPSACGDGVLGRIFVDGVERFQQAAYVSTVPYSIIVPVNFGSRVDFIIDPRANDFCDAAQFTAHIETSDPGSSVVANSVADWSSSGTQGEKNWYYGYYNRTADPGGVYAASDFTPFPRSNIPFGPGNYWTGALWDWPAGDPPWDTIGQVDMHPNGVNSATGGEHWVIRRWVSEVGGRITVDWTVAKANLAGNGVTGHLFHNGVQMDIASIAGNNGAGSSRSVTLTNVHVGDFIDLALDPTGNLGANDDGSDGSTMTMVIRGTPTLTDAISSNIQAAMKNVNSVAYIRIPFAVTNAAAVRFLTLRMRYDDGFVAYLNGVNVAFRNAFSFQDPLTWNSVATANRFDGDSNQAEDIDITPFVGLLHDGTNMLAIHGLNINAADSDFLILPQLSGLSVSFGTNGGYFATPTPGAANGAASTNLGPIIVAASHLPEPPRDTDDITVTAVVTPSFNSISNVQLTYRVNFSNEVTVGMLDDGLHGDGSAGDGVYGAIIPAAASNPGEMVRYFIQATDSQSNRTRFPAFAAPLDSPEYLGTVVYVAQTNTLSLLHWFVANPAAAALDAGTRCSVYYNGQFLDNIGVTLHGQSSSTFPKHSYNFNLNSGYKLSVSSQNPKLGDFALISTWADRSHVRVPLNTETYQRAGVPAHYTFPLRVQQNGTFFCVSVFSEQGNDKYLERIGYDPDGALYKMYNTFTGAAGNEKKTRKYEGSSDLQEFYNAIASAPDVPSRTAYLWDNVNVPNMINFLAAKTISSDHDCCHKNYYYYRDSNKSGEWYALPWDFDLSWGHIWTSLNGWSYFDDTIITNLVFGVGNNNTEFALMWADATFHAMWLRRTRTLMDEILQPAGTAPNTDFLRSRIEDYGNQVRADATLDKVKWGGATWSGGGAPQYGPGNANNANPTNNFEAELVRLKDFYLTGRRSYLAASAGSFGIPNSQPTNVFIGFGAIDYNPASANQAQEYIELLNTNNFVVDMTGWKVKGAVDFTFDPGTTVAAGGRIYVTPNVKAFRARTTGPRGGQRLLAVGSYNGQLSARGETLALVNTSGQTNTSLTYVGNPSPAQLYLRVTEIMYHPPSAPAGSPFDTEDFEYIELRNIGPGSLNLAGIHFTNGVEFTFSAGSLAAGQHTVVVRNLAAFNSRYGNSLNVAGVFTGILDNAGENVRLDDAVGEKILDFTFDNRWYPITDGPGASLVIVDAAADWRSWDLKSSWRPSAYDLGSPAASEPPTNSYQPVYIHELLSHSDPPLTDAIELFNPGATPANISGWFLSDDPATPRKYTVPNGTTIPAGGFLVFTEAQFNASPGVPPSFALSSLGDEAFLFSGNGTNLTGWLDAQAFGATESNVSLGRYTNSQGAIHFVAQSSTTLGTHNALPKVGPAVISEIMYHPPDLPVVGDNSQDEFIEVSNLSGTPLRLFDPAFPTNTWRLRSAVTFDFPTNVTLPAGGIALVTSFNPTNVAVAGAFRTRFNIPAQVPIFGPWSGQLDNSSESVRLEKPDAPFGGEIPYVLVERIDYADIAPWAAAADGLGGSLQRLVAGAYGNDPTNWIGAAPTAGAPFVPGGIPVITAPPSSLSALQGSMATFSVTVTGAPPFAYQWQFNSNNIVGANSSLLILGNISANHAGAYRVIVLGAGGSVVSANAALTVLLPAVITAQPTNIEVRVRPDPGADVAPFTNASFSVSATTANPPLSYRWRINGTNLNPSPKFGSLTTTTLVVSNVVIEDYAEYSCAVTDANGTIYSSNATLYPLVRPTILIPPATQTVPAHSPVATSVVLSNGFPPPFRYIWYRASAPFATNISDSKTNYIVIPGIIISNLSLQYSVRLTNRALTSIVSANSAFFNLTTIADSDLDGMPDNFEMAYSGSTTNFAPGLDADGDGMSNLAEFLAGTDPGNSNSFLRINQSIVPGAVSVNFAALSNHTYTIQFSDTVPSANWQRLADIVTKTSNRVEVLTDPNWVTNRFYRAVTPRQP